VVVHKHHIATQTPPTRQACNPGCVMFLSPKPELQFPPPIEGPHGLYRSILYFEYGKVFGSYSLFQNHFIHEIRECAIFLLRPARECIAAV